MRQWIDFRQCAKILRTSWGTEYTSGLSYGRDLARCLTLIYYITAQRPKEIVLDFLEESAVVADSIVPSTKWSSEKN